MNSNHRYIEYLYETVKGQDIAFLHQQKYNLEYLGNGYLLDETSPEFSDYLFTQQSNLHNIIISWDKKIQNSKEYSLESIDNDIYNNLIFIDAIKGIFGSGGNPLIDTIRASILTDLFYGCHNKSSPNIYENYIEALKKLTDYIKSVYGVESFNVPGI